MPLHTRHIQHQENGNCSSSIAAHGAEMTGALNIGVTTRSMLALGVEALDTLQQELVQDLSNLYLLPFFNPAAELLRDQWQALVGLRGISQKHHEFLLASKHSRASQAYSRASATHSAMLSAFILFCSCRGAATGKREKASNENFA